MLAYHAGPDAADLLGRLVRLAPDLIEVSPFDELVTDRA